uniref:Nuclear autoantigenic sperm protein n=1 Tax=Gorilla gorilla gorilla TaxID=9595 RepID=A0A2I2YBD5_GORGO
MATESTATAAIAAELVSANKIEDVPAPSTSADKVERIKNGVLGNTLGGVIDEEARKESTEQVYDSMGEKEEAKKTEDKSLAKPETDKEQDCEMEKGGREDMDISESAEEPQEKVDLNLGWLTEISEGAKGGGASEGPNEAEVTSGKPEQEVPDAEEEKSVSETDVQEECREKGGWEKHGEVIVSIEEKPKEVSEEQPVVTLEKQGTAVEVEAESLDPTVKSVDVGGDKPEEKVVTSEKAGKVVLEQLVGQEVPPVEESPEATTEAAEASAVEAGSEVSEKPGQEATVLPKDGAVNGPSAVGDQTPTEPQTSIERLTETKDVQIAANEETKEREEQIEEEEEIGNLELAWNTLDLAKIVFKRQETKAQLCVAQARLKLGEVGVESENYVQAVEEFQSCLKLWEQYLEAHDRLLAETHYQLGLAYGYNSQYDEAVAQFNKSIEEAENRVESRAAVEGTVEAGATVESTACKEGAQPSSQGKVFLYIMYFFTFGGFFLYNFNKDCKQRLRL